MTRIFHNPHKLIFPLTVWIEGCILRVEATASSRMSVR